MKFKSISLALSLALLSTSGAALQATTQGQLPIAEIIKRFAAAESQNKIARNNYTFTQDVDIMTLGEAGSITGRFRRTSDLVYDDRGNRVEKITFFPPSTLEVTVTQHDMQDLAGVQPFALTAEDLPKYQVDFVGKEKIDELNTYIFDVKPKEIRKGERYLEGRIWVDDEDLQIVKVAGKGVPETNNDKYPRFETYRENIDGKFWFPTYTYADDILEFKRPVRIRMVIRYTKYKKFTTDIRVADEGEVATEEDIKAGDKDKKPVDKDKDKEKKPESTEKPKRKPGN
jgi:hypothetical protein